MEKKTMSLYTFGLVMILAVCAKTSVCEINCLIEIASMMSCQNFLVGMEPSPTAECCSYLAAIARDGDTKEARQQLCECFKKSASSYGVKPDKAKVLPNLCHIRTPVPVDANVNCSSIPF